MEGEQQQPRGRSKKRVHNNNHESGGEEPEHRFPSREPEATLADSAAAVAEQYNKLKPAVVALADYTAPDFSVFFIVFFALITYSHETYYAQSLIGLCIWAGLQLFSVVLNDDFRINIFWNVFALLGNLVFYLFLGYCWSMLKLYVDIWQGHMPEALMAQIRESIKTGTFGAVLLQLKWIIMRWTITWPAWPKCAISLQRSNCWLPVTAG